MIEKAIAESIEMEKTYQEKRSFCNIHELYVKLEETMLDNWIIRKKENYVYFYYIEDEPYPRMKCCVRVTEDCELSVLCGNVEVKSFCESSYVFPIKVTSICAGYAYFVIQKLLLPEYESTFLKQTNQRQTASALICHSLCESDYQLFSGHNCLQHSCSEIIKKLLMIFCNILLNNYMKKQNDIVKPKSMPQCKRFKSVNNL